MEKGAMSDDKALAGVIEAVRKVDIEKPTKEAKAEFDRILREHPTFWRVAGDVIEHTAQGMIKEVAPRMQSELPYKPDGRK
jgi:hypothetical protein